MIIKINKNNKRNLKTKNKKKNYLKQKKSFKKKKTKSNLNISIYNFIKEKIFYDNF
jgi:hypothetical protein